MTTRYWPYRRVLAHRGGGALAPENTLAAIREGLRRGYRAVEFDVMLSADEVPVLMHDPDFGRTVPGPGRVAETPAAALQALDAGAWFGPQYRNEPVPLYHDVVEFCRTQGIFMNVEIKPSPGREARTGEIVASLTRAWVGAADAREAVLLSSFSGVALESALVAAPDIARAHLFDRVPGDWSERLARLGCRAIHCNQRTLDFSMIERFHGVGLGVFCYTVNDLERARALFAAGVDAFCTDRIDLIGAEFGNAEAR